MNHPRRHTSRAIHFVVLTLALAALMGYVSMRDSGFSNRVQAKSGPRQMAESSESLKASRSSLDQAIAHEKLNPSREASAAVDAALGAYNESRASRMRAIRERMQELETTVRAIAQGMSFQPGRLKQSPETKPFMEEHEALTAEFVTLSRHMPLVEQEGNDTIATADRIIAGTSDRGTRSGVIEPGGDVDFYSIEASQGEVLSFSATLDQTGAKQKGAKQKAGIKFELLGPDGKAKLFSINDGSAKAPGKPSDFTVPKSGRYFVRVKAGTAKQPSGYELSVRRGSGSVAPSIRFEQVCTTFDFESETHGFTVENVIGPALWHPSTECGAELPTHSTPTTFYYGIECNNGLEESAIKGPSIAAVEECGSTCDYETGARNASNLVSPVVNVTSPASLTFNYLLFVEATVNVDRPAVDVSTDGGSTWTTVLDKGDGTMANPSDFINDNTWHSATVDLSPFVGMATSVRVRFTFDTVDSLFNSTTGWHVDDVKICGVPSDACATDTEPPQIDCPEPFTAVAPPACPVATGTMVDFDTPSVGAGTLSDNCPGVTAMCTPSAGSIFPVGTTTVTCTATDQAGNTATCSFAVTVFNACIQDDTVSTRVILFNTFTGEYRACCGNSVSFTGQGTVTKQGCSYTLQHNAPNRRITAKIDLIAKKGSGSIQFNPGNTICTITDRDIRNNSCECERPRT
ncbi:MAG TPA: HYR domain-containing protein [Blastocatellia bacterium]|nr:HYR domain-containing protein [Blastocatellia bacterium]